MSMLYDVITVGGGLAGSTLAKNLAEHGYRVLVLERETRFKDRIRGETLNPWGVTEARTLGIYDHLLATCGNQTRWLIKYDGPTLRAKRDLVETTPHRVGAFNFYHPAMQEVLLGLAMDAGAEVRRGVSVECVVPGYPASVSFQESKQRKTVPARLVVGADGRNSHVRRWGDFQVKADPDCLVVAGALVEGMLLPDDAVYQWNRPGKLFVIVPLGNQCARTYFVYRSTDCPRTLSGKTRMPAYLAACRSTDVPTAWLEQKAVIGPLAHFNRASHCVYHPGQRRI